MVLLAHAGHWAIQALYVLPLLVFFVILVRTKLRERRERGAVGPEPLAGPDPDPRR
jgi:hypothetical protein